MLQVIDNKTFSKVVNSPSSLDENAKNKVREYAKVVKARNEILAQLKKLDDMIALIDGNGLKNKLWVNQKGEVIPIFDIDDDYLKNIYSWCLKNSKEPSVQIKKEYISRFSELPTVEESSNKYAPATGNNGSSFKRSASYTDDRWHDDF